MLFKTLLHLTVGMFLGAVVAVGTMLLAQAATQPVIPYDSVGTEITVPCPTEDSCGYPTYPAGWSADYRDHAWHFTKVGE